jgi:phage FluMu protein Com
MRALNRRVSMLENMNEFRCPKCNRLFFRFKLKGDLFLEVRCNRCKQNTTLILGGDK